MTDVRARVNELYGQVMRQGEGPAGHYRVEDVLSAGAANQATGPSQPQQPQQGRNK